MVIKVTGTLVLVSRLKKAVKIKTNTNIEIEGKIMSKTVEMIAASMAKIENLYVISILF